VKTLALSQLQTTNYAADSAFVIIRATHTSGALFLCSFVLSIVLL
jgi:hypothetical protein